jgi:hypothetical protein
MRDEAGLFEFGNQVLISNHRKPGIHGSWKAYHAAGAGGRRNYPAVCRSRGSTFGEGTSATAGS